MTEVVLKFGSIKSVSFSEENESSLAYDCLCGKELWLESQDAEYRIEVVKFLDTLKESDVIFSWWDQRNVTKEEAKEYIKNYGKEGKDD
jgi:hypothetical protein